MELRDRGLRGGGYDEALVEVLMNLDKSNRKDTRFIEDMGPSVRSSAIGGLLERGQLGEFEGLAKRLFDLGFDDSGTPRMVQARMGELSPEYAEGSWARDILGIPMGNNMGPMYPGERMTDTEFSQFRGDRAANRLKAIGILEKLFSGLR